jgi:hypothetical protein
MSTTPAGWTHRALLMPMVCRLALRMMPISTVFPVASPRVDLCRVHRATGLPCPGRGLTRAFTLALAALLGCGALRLVAILLLGVGYP